jgi:hypothetical protein
MLYVGTKLWPRENKKHLFLSVYLITINLISENSQATSYRVHRGNTHLVSMLCVRHHTVITNMLHLSQDESFQARDQNEEVL